MTHQMDEQIFKNCVLSGDWKEEIYMTPHKGFEVKGQEIKFANLKSLYGLKKTLNLRHEKFDQILFKRWIFILWCL